jgi:hypothetical protein
MNNSKTYRSQTVQQMDVSQMLSGRDGQAAVVIDFRQRERTWNVNYRGVSQMRNLGYRAGFGGGNAG